MKALKERKRNKYWIIEVRSGCRMNKRPYRCFSGEQAVGFFVEHILKEPYRFTDFFATLAEVAPPSEPRKKRSRQKPSRLLLEPISTVCSCGYDDPLRATVCPNCEAKVPRQLEIVFQGVIC